MRQNPSVMNQAPTPRTLTLKSNQGTKSGTLKKPMFCLFDVIIFFIIFFFSMGKQNKIFRAQLPVSNV